MLLDLLRFGGQNVALLGLTAEDFPRTGLLKALGRALMGLQFGHGSPAKLSVFLLLRIIRESGWRRYLGPWCEGKWNCRSLHCAALRVGMTKGGVALPWGIS